MKTIWLLIYVHHGFIQEPEIFVDKQSALKRKKKILKEYNADYDEVEIFEKIVL
jgi:ribosome-associated protein YbcJ (S4-like RNA binding protein)